MNYDIFYDHYEIGDGAYFGEMSLVEEIPRTATITAIKVRCDHEMVDGETEITW